MKRYPYSKNMTEEQIRDKFYFNLELDKGEEIFVKCPEFPNYRVSSYGRVINKKNKLLKPTFVQEGYFWFQLTNKDGERKSISASNLTMLAFQGKHTDSYNVHHKDRMIYNNHISNLQWLTVKEHRLEHQKSFSQIAFRKKVKIEQISKETSNKIAEFESIGECARALGLGTTTVSHYVNNNMKNRFWYLKRI